MKIGMHTGQQDCPFDDLRRVWRLADENGFAWVSVWDHFYEAPYLGGGSPVYETVSTMAALASMTKNVRVGCLVYSAGYRPPALMAKVATTLDHISNGRVTLGMGAGWHAAEYEAFGYEFPGPKIRLDMLEESVQIIKSMLTTESTTFDGAHFRVTDAQCNPKPVQENLPVWIGGQGEKRTLRLAARYADGWNAAYISAEAFKHKNEVLDSWCDVEKRDPAKIERSINVNFVMGADDVAARRNRENFEQQWGARAQSLVPGALLGRSAQVIEQIGHFRDLGTENLNIALRPPFDWEAIQAFIEEVMPKFR
ncbi:MAG: TIGR03560 family F420-dependent LLM class oxidoreductase [Chloroflexi bacterium]|nr:TIGR03560 family F420-dependent LLM class oxidoreductase [Chloroflexota bacterium]